MSNGTTSTASTTGDSSSFGVDAGTKTGYESNLSNWAGPYVTEMLGRGQAVASTPYTAYQGPLTAGESALQKQAFSGLANLTVPTTQMGPYSPTSFTGTYQTAEGKKAPIAQQYMSPYLMAALEPQLAEARRQAEIDRIASAGRLAKAGAYGGSRQAIMESEGLRNLASQLANITGTGYQKAFESAQSQFNTEQDRQAAAAKAAQDYGLGVLAKQTEAGGLQRDIEQQGIAADYAQFKEERDYPYKQVSYLSSLLQGLPIQAQSYTVTQPSTIEKLMAGTGSALDLYDRISALFAPSTGGTK